MAEMSVAEAREILAEHNRWRRGDDEARRGDIASIGIAIDVLIAATPPASDLPALARWHSAQAAECYRKIGAAP